MSLDQEKENEGKSQVSHENTEIIGNENVDKPSAHFQVNSLRGVNLGIHEEPGYYAVTGISDSNKQITGDKEGQGISGNAEVIAKISETAGYLSYP